MYRSPSAVTPPSLLMDSFYRRVPMQSMGLSATSALRSAPLFPHQRTVRPQLPPHPTNSRRNVTSFMRVPRTPKVSLSVGPPSSTPLKGSVDRWRPIKIGLFLICLEYDKNNKSSRKRKKKTMKKKNLGKRKKFSEE